jgi:beta-lactam-binding protein with PASTA domain
VNDQEKVLVPALVGLEVSEAHERAFDARLVAVAVDPVAPLPVSGVVTAQSPAAGTRVDPGDSVEIVVDSGPDDGGGGGGGAPLAPHPGPLDPAGTKPLP